MSPTGPPGSLDPSGMPEALEGQALGLIHFTNKTTDSEAERFLPIMWIPLTRSVI